MDNKNMYRSNFNVNFTILHKKGMDNLLSNYHLHDEYEIFYSLSNNIKCLVDEDLYIVEKNNILLFNNTDAHKFIVSDINKCERFVIQFNPRFINHISYESIDLLECFFPSNSIKKNYCIKIPENKTSEMLALFENAKIKYEKSKFKYNCIIHHQLILAEILLYINELYIMNCSPLVIHHDSAYETIKPLLRYINNNPSENLSLKKLSNRFFISQSHMQRLFKSTTGFTVNSYVLRTRISKAKELLIKDLPVSLVAERTGFQNLSHFSKTYKKFTGFSPKQYSKYYSIEKMSLL